ncbi:hypothetical protein BDZ97DRAFT_1768396 [Flammula alnicola]|nr:hypothetical protein BDZ97DRAFT_1768396 [Flammula alnicola]
MVSPGRGSSVPRESFAINQPHKSTFTSATPSDSEDEEDQDELPFKKHRAACSDDDSDEGEQPEVMSVDNDKSTGQERIIAKMSRVKTHRLIRPRDRTVQTEASNCSRAPRGRLLVTPRVPEVTIPGLRFQSNSARSRAPLRRAPVAPRDFIDPEPSNASTGTQESPRTSIEDESRGSSSESTVQD